MITPLEPSDTFCLSAALGWVELGNPAEALEELAKLSEPAKVHPDAMEVHWQVLASQNAWDAALQVAERIVARFPNRSSGWLHQAYALRRATGGGLQAAWNALLPAYQRFPEESTIPYNLACYACQMGQTDEAQVWLNRAMDLGDRARIRIMALADSDLKPLWSRLRQRDGG